jgi:NAD(P)H dehydrogenase (quinone)
MMAKVLVVYYSRSGNTQKMAQVVAEGAREVAGAEAEVRPAAEVTPDDLLPYDGIIMGSPVYFGSMAAELKTLIDESVKHYGKLTGKVGGAFASSGAIGGGTETTVLDILKAMLIHGMIVQGTTQGAHYGAVAFGAPDERACKDCRGLGRRVAELAKRLAVL